MANKQLTNSDINDIVNRIIREVNRILAQYGILGIMALVIIFGVALLAITYLPWVLGIILVALIAYYVWQNR